MQGGATGGMEPPKGTPIYEQLPCNGICGQQALSDITAMPASHLLPNLEILQEEYLLVEAWKKTVAHMRAHNWFADTLEIDRASIDLPRFLKDLARRMSDPSGFETRRLRLVPAPKSHRWTFTNTGDRVKWEPEVDPNGLGPRVRPLAHVDLSDQVAATAILLCLADRVETEQGNPAASLVDAVNRRQVLSYGNRLLCDVDGGRLNHRWGSRALYRSFFFQDYRTFLSRPSVAAESVSGDGKDIVIVQSDLRNFYDRVRPALLAQKIHALRLEGEHNDFFDLAEKVLTWRWDPRDQAGVNAYAEREGIPDFADVALPQGLASAGFFANVVLLEFDHRLIDSFSREIFTGAYLVDATRYVDDLRIVLKLNSERDLSEVENDTSAWLTSLVKDEPGVTVSTEKTHAAYFGVHVNRPTVRQSDRMTRIQSAVSGGFDVAGGEAILEAVRGLMQTQRRHPQQQVDAAGWALSPVADVPDATVARFAAGRFRRAYRWLRPLVEDSESSPKVSEEGDQGGSERELAASAPVRTQAELDNDAEVFAAGLIQTWVEDPSNIRLLRIAFDIWPSASTLKLVLALLMPYAERERDDEAHQIARYCLAELLRSGASETGLVKDAEVLPLDIDEYRAVLQAVGERIVENHRAELPWYLRQKALLFLAAHGSTHDHPNGRDRETSHYAALLRFLSDPDSAPSASDFATYSVLARRSFARSRAARMLVHHVNRPRLTKIAEADPALAMELVELDPRLSELLPDYIRRDLCLIRTLPSGSVSLADLVLRGENPFRDELALLQFAIQALKILRRGQSGTVAPVDLAVKILDSEPWGVRNGRFELQLHYRRRLEGSIYSPPSWCPEDERWRFQLGYLLRFILTGDADFTISVRPTPWRESRGNSYRPAPMPWRMRRYGFFNAHEAFGDRWLPITEWTTELLLDLLAWPGARRPNHPWIEGGIDQTSEAIRNRIQEILNWQGHGRSEMLLKVAVDPPVPIKKIRSLRAAVVQTVLPEQHWFKPGSETLTVAERKMLRQHLTAALAAVRSSLRLRRTHMNGGGELDLLILPELSVHADDLGILRAFAITHKTIILAGLVYQTKRERGDGLPLVNSAVWLLPERTRLGGHNVRVVDQGKKYLAPEETQVGLHLRSFRIGQWLIGYPWSPNRQDPPLWLTASVCYDATDLALAADLKGKSDVYVIPARNKDVPTFDKMALALHYHMFQMVIVANNGAFGGSNAYVPYKRSLQTTAVPLSWPATSRDRLSGDRSDQSVLGARQELAGSGKGTSVQTASSGPDLIGDVR